MELKESEMERLIELYEGEENLYNYRLKDYFDRQKTRQSITFIAASMGKGWSVHTTKIKLRSLRTSYTRERKAADSGERKPTWKWYSSMDAFLRPFTRSKTGGHIMKRERASDKLPINPDTLPINPDGSVGMPDHKPYSKPAFDADVKGADLLPLCDDIELLLRRTQAKLNSEDQCISAGSSDIMDLECESIDPSVDKPKPEKQRRQEADPEVKTRLQHMPLQKRQKNVNENFGAYIGSILDSFPPVVQRKARRQISILLMDMEDECG